MAHIYAYNNGGNIHIQYNMAGMVHEGAGKDDDSELAAFLLRDEPAQRWG